MCTISSRAVDPDPHSFSLLDPDPDPDLQKMKAYPQPWLGVHCDKSKPFRIYIFKAV